MKIEIEITELPVDFKCSWVDETKDCTQRGKKCFVCSKAVRYTKELPIQNYFTPYPL